MVIAATPVALAAFCVADDPRVVRRPPRAAAGLLLRGHNHRPGQGFEAIFPQHFSKIRT
jgi:hypothetical protein